MDVILTCVRGPLDGVYEFPNYSCAQPPATDANRLSAWMLMTLTNGEVGRGASGVSPAMLALLQGQQPIPGRGAPHTYVIGEREQGGETLHVKAIYRAPPDTFEHSDSSKEP